MPAQFDDIKEFLDKSLMESDHVLVNFNRDLYAMLEHQMYKLVWRKDITQQDPNYAFEGQWKKKTCR